MQSSGTTIALAYSSDNRAYAEHVEQALSTALPFQHFPIDRDQGSSLQEQLQSFAGPVLLFVSDNFLRSTKSLEGGLRMINNHQEKLLPVIIPGFRKDADGTTQEVATNFDRVSDIIQYINHWQDRYLDLRRQKREDPDLNTEGFADHLKIVRSISGEVGEYIRHLRNLEPLSWERFTADYFGELFEFLGEPELAATYQEEALKSGVDNTIDSPDVEEVPVDVQTIPGIAALMEDTAEQSVTEEEVTEAVAETAAIAPMTEEAEVEAPAATVEEKVSTIEEEEQSIATALDVAATIDEAWRMVDAEQQGEALALLDEKLDTHPQDHDLHYNYAILLAQEGRTQDAQLQVDWLLQDGTDNEDVYFLAGELADIQEDGPRAREFYLKAVELEPEFGEAWYQLGQTAINYQTDDTERTVKYLKKALKYSNETNAAFQIGKLYAEELDQPKKAIKYFKKAIKIAPENGNAHYELARTYHRLRELDRARRAYQTAAIVQPELQTPESDLAFGLTTVAAGQTNEDQAQTLAALKENIKHLEDLLHQQSASEAPAGVSKKAGKTVFITGATAGIGKATAHKFASEGYRLIITGRRADRLTELQSEWQEAYGVDVHPLTFDVRDPEAVTAAIDGLPKDWQQIDILINNAGKAKGFDPIHEGQLSHWEEMIDTNLKGLLYLTRAVSPHMVERGSGHIINVASTAGKEVYPKGNVYCATKFAVDALTKGMRMDLHSHGVRVSQVAPAHVEETEFALVRFDGDAERAQIYEGFQPLRSPDVAETIFFIATQPLHVNILDVVLQGTQQPHSMIIDRSGRDKYQEEE